jgi:23S rRNA (uracil1939-C5)-methyltransferase
MESIKFSIDHMDPLGQGVSKYDKISFIAKTLPGEKGTAKVYRKAKGVLFGRLNNPDLLEAKSKNRIDSECPYFNECRGCQYLHTNYRTELEFKSNSLDRIFKSLLPDPVKLTVHPAMERFGYRNRVQLHYDIQKKEFGYFSNFSEHLIDAGKCLLPSESIMKSVENLYLNGKWEDIVKNSNEITGYIEIYQKPDESTPKITINKAYAEGGFTQVNNKMGQVLADLVCRMYNNYLDNRTELLILDIFGGNGNLSNNFKNAHIKVYDIKSDKSNISIIQNPIQHYVNIDLYKKNPVHKIKNTIKDSQFTVPDLVIFDPPRAGIKFIESYLEHLDSSYIFYISCDPATMKRDTQKIVEKYEIIEIHLIDLFPATRHYETLIIFKKKADRENVSLDGNKLYRKKD